MTEDNPVIYASNPVCPTCGTRIESVSRDREELYSKPDGINMVRVFDSPITTLQPCGHKIKRYTLIDNWRDTP